jgi:hypothetical protein
VVEDNGGLSDVDAATLDPLVRSLLGEPAAIVGEDWSCRPLGGGAGEGLGLYRIAGSAQVNGDSRPWAIVVKVSAAANGAALDAWDFPAREEIAYGSGLLADLPEGLSAPRCLAIETRPDRTTRLWLEAVADAHPGPWSRERYAEVARHLGRFNGAYLHGTPLPDHPWLGRAWLRDFTEPSASFVRELPDLAGPEGPPMLQRLYPPPVVREIERLWAERELFLTALDRLPQTFCHQDAFRRNLLLRAGPAGEELVAVDWAYSGLGAIGEDLEQLVMGSLFFFAVDGASPAELDAVCFAGYVAGLREAGWDGDARLVRLGFTAAIALRHTVALLQLVCPALSDSALRSEIEELFGGVPLEEVVDRWVALWPFQFALAEEARMLLPLVN